MLVLSIFGIVAIKKIKTEKKVFFRKKKGKKGEKRKKIVKSDQIEGFERA